MAPPSHRRGRLSQGLDREVHQVIRKIQDERAQYDDLDGGTVHLSFAWVYDEIKRSNSSLNRKPKKILEDSIERVLETMRQDTAQSDSEEGDLPMTPELARPLSNGLNKSIVKAWSRTTGTSTPVEAQPAEVATEAVQVNGEPPRKKRKRGPAIDRSPPTHINLDDLGGVEEIIEKFKDLLTVPLLFPEAYETSKMQPIRGILIHGPPGCGKTTIANAIAAEFDVSFISISAPSVVSGMSGESEKAIREHFEEAKKAAPCLLFIDEIDAITPKREAAQREMEKRIVAQLSTCMDDLDLAKTDGKPVIVLAATNRPDSLDPALRRGGRFDKEISMNVPTEQMRASILKALTRQTLLDTDVDLDILARRTPGFVGADLRDLYSTACNVALRRFQDSVLSAALTDNSNIIEAPQPSAPTIQALDKLQPSNPTSTLMDLEPTSTTPTTTSSLLELRRLLHYRRMHPTLTLPPIHLTQHDFLTSLPQISPSSLREGFATIPSTTFTSIGALTPLIRELHSTIITPILSPTIFTSLGITPTSGALLWGPPGCGKTLLAKACANASHANFISVKGPELLNKYVGESERAVRSVFTRARASTPVLVFFDELDALVPARNSSAGSQPSANVVNTLLSELDGADPRSGIFVLAATNRPDIIDPAMLRPGRLETMLYVGLPDGEGRVEILRTLCIGLPGFEWGTDGAALERVARECEGFSGADLEALKRRAGYAAVRRCGVGLMQSNADGVELRTDAGVPKYSFALTAADFEVAKNEVRRSVSDTEVKRYDRLRKEWERT